MPIAVCLGRGTSRIFAASTTASVPSEPTISLAMLKRGSTTDH